MKMMRFILIVAVSLMTVLTVSAQKKGEKTVVYKADLHCESCKTKVEKNIPYEKGVKDLKVDLTAKTITVTFKEDKNSAEGIQKAIEKLNIAVTASDAKAGDKKCEGKCGDNCCSKTGKKDDCCKDKKK